MSASAQAVTRIAGSWSARAAVTEKVSRLTKVSAAGRRMLRESGLDMDSQHRAGMPLVVVVHFAQNKD